MKTTLLLGAALLVTLAVSTVEAITPGLLLAGVAKAAFVKGALYGSGGFGRGRNRGFNRRRFNNNRRGGGYWRRGKRSDGSDNDAALNYFLEASLEDSNDCLKSFVCLSSALPFESREDLEHAVVETFSAPFINPLSDAAEFQLASAIGQEGGALRCRRVYARCEASYDDVRSQLEEVFKAEEEIALEQAGALEENKLI